MNEPAEWLLANLDLIRPGGRVWDVASGSGRNALFLVTHGWQVHAVDRDAAALASLVAQIEPDASGALTTECIDLETGPVPSGSPRYDAVIVFNYLHRPLLPALVDAVAPGGVLIYETFTRAQAARGRPRNPAFLLDAGELPTLVSPLRVLRAREGEFGGKCVASIAAMR
jgi:SAM-dependent methyltransferase